jgi:hypothetical protein
MNLSLPWLVGAALRLQAAVGCLRQVCEHATPPRVCGKRFADARRREPQP